MACTPLCLLVLSSLCAGSAAQFVLTQPPAESVAPGGTVRLPCTRSGDGEGISDRYVSWYQQKPGSVPKCVIYGHTQRPSDTPSRFSGSLDSSTNSAHLTITGAHALDEAVYYCLSYDSSARFIFGDGSQLNVLSGETKTPTMSIFPPSTEEIAGKKATVVCQCQNYYPAALVWSWTVNGQTINTGVDSTRPTKQTENNLFMAASYLSIDALDWNANKNYTCLATHEGKTFQASVKQSECV